MGQKFHVKAHIGKFEKNISFTEIGSEKIAFLLALHTRWKISKFTQTAEGVDFPEAAAEFERK